MSHIKETSFSIDADKALAVLGEHLFHPDFTIKSRMFITNPPGVDALYGKPPSSAYDVKAGGYVTVHQENMELNSRFKGTYLEEVVSEATSYLEATGFDVGRFRVLKLQPLEAYNVHVDNNEYRFHIPLITSEFAFFITEGDITYMNKPGVMYQMRTDISHSAINMSNSETRFHLIIDVRPK